MADNTAQNINQAAQNTIAGMNAVASTIGSKKDMERQAKYNKESMDYANRINRQNYEQQLADTYEMKLNEQRFQKQGLINAGLNPSWNESAGVSSVGAEIGASSALPVEAGHPAQKGIEAFIATRSMFLQNQLMEAQAAKTAQEAKSVKLANEETEDERNSIQLTQFLMLGDKATIDDDGTIWVNYGDNEDSTIRVDQLPKTKRGYEALNSFRQYERNKYVSQSEEDKALLEDMVSKMQIVDKDVLKALSNMPTEVIRELRAKNSAQEMENEIVGASKDVWRQLEDKPDIIKFLASAFYTFITKK